jgi:hypothetical protein
VLGGKVSVTSHVLSAIMKAEQSPEFGMDFAQCVRRHTMKMPRTRAMPSEEWREST